MADLAPTCRVCGERLTCRSEAIDDRCTACFRAARSRKETRINPTGMDANGLSILRERLAREQEARCELIRAAEGAVAELFDIQQEIETIDELLAGFAGERETAAA